MGDKLADFFAAPFHGDMDAVDWFLFLGLLMVIAIMWRFILIHITEAVTSGS